METEPSKEFYSISDAEAQQTYVGVRRAAKWVGFFLPHLRPGFSVLDCGCGVGSITLDLAEQVAPGQVVGIEVDEGQLAVARQRAVERGLANVSFQQGNVYALTFEEGTFDAVLAHTLLMHLSDPLRALQEIRRVLTPGGLAGISDDDWQTFTYSPQHPLMEKIVNLWIQVMRHNGGNPHYSRHLRGLMLQAGFVRTEGHAVAADYYGNLQETRRLAGIHTRMFRNADMVSLITNQGWATHAEIDELIGWVQQWGERPDAFVAVMYCAAIGWTE
jgi:ubiquinone/menaquinone biosynthesis C-methylase UbiE